MAYKELVERPLDPPEHPAMPICPVCGEEAETFYLDIYGDVVGCDCCVEKRDSFDYEEGRRVDFLE